MSTVISRDGAPIAYERQGSGPAVILVGGGLDDGAENAPLAAELAGDSDLQLRPAAVAARAVTPSQGHVVDPGAMAAELRRFFG